MKKSLFISMLSALAITSPVAAAEPFPSKPITIIVGVAPGGSLDALARLVGNNLANVTKQSVIVENVTGAGGLIGFQRLTKSAPDGYTLMFSNNSMVLIPLLQPQSGLDVVADTAPIGTVANVPMVLSVSNKSGITDLPSMLTSMRAGKLRPNLGSGGPGTTSHLAEAMFLQMAKAEGELVQYRGSGPALTDLMAGTIEAMIDQTVTMMSLHQGNRIKAIAVASKERPKTLSTSSQRPCPRPSTRRNSVSVWTSWPRKSPRPPTAARQASNAPCNAIRSSLQNWAARLAWPHAEPTFF